MEYKLEQSGAMGILTIDGELTVQYAHELKSALLKSLDNVDHLVLNLAKVTSIDLSCLQLLCSAHRTSGKLNKQLSLIGDRPEALQQAAKNAGYLRHVGCSYDAHKDCLWKERST